MVFTNAPEEFSAQTLERYEWNLEQSINEFFNQNLSEQIQNEPETTNENSSEIPKWTPNKNPNQVLITNMFRDYRNEESGEIEETGFEDLLKVIEIDLLEINSLIFVWHLRAKSPGKLTRDEFVEGMITLRCDNVNDIMCRKETFLDDIKEDNHWRNFYIFAFKYSLEKPEEKFIPYNIATQLWKMVLPEKCAYYKDWLEFLQQKKYVNKNISYDVWRCFGDFILNIKKIEKSYENCEWPFLIDEFVDYYLKK
ncbi:rp42 related [Anaeramoeba flamelloides]|uniref:Defective in cullin neddylation protein n=1 Tax=Anaeramoeba flamelloides TaxID=1746091 RepID=A0AAV7Y4H2_9EUKA|nr:rp42 related [Anaeramoeba flamelloides]KAJ6234621.1 rp42 related [Anaeramoeba flamelloides]